MIRPRHGAVVGTATVALMLLTSACASGDDGGADTTADAGGAQAAASDSGAGFKVRSTEYKLDQAFDLSMELTSTVFSRIRRIPIEYSCTDNYYYPESGFAFRYGEDRSPPLAWTDAPDGTASFALIVDDPDSLTLEKGLSEPRVHWVVWNIPADVTELPEHVATTTEVLSLGPNTRQGVNGYKGIGYGGPCPPPNITSISGPGLRATQQQKPHGYVFRVYALDTELDLAAGATKNQLLRAMEGHILGGGELRGEYVNKKLFK